MLTAISAPLVGVTGDNSLAQALSFGKIPFYEAFGHKKQFAWALLKLIEENLGENSALENYIKSRTFDKPSKGDLLQPEIAEQAKLLGEIIREKFSANPMIKGIVNEQLFLNSYPESGKTINNIRQQYLDSDITIEELEQQIKQELHHKGLF